MSTSTPDERLRRWRLVLGGAAAEGTGRTLSGTDAAMDAAPSAACPSCRRAR